MHVILDVFSQVCENTRARTDAQEHSYLHAHAHSQTKKTDSNFMHILYFISSSTVLIVLILSIFFQIISQETQKNSKVAI